MGCCFFFVLKALVFGVFLTQNALGQNWLIPSLLPADYNRTETPTQNPTGKFTFKYFS